MAGQQTLQDFLAGPVLTELVSTYDTQRGLPDIPLPKLMEKSSANPVVGMEVMYNRFIGSRQTSLLVGPNSPSVRVEQTGVTRMFQTAMGTRENFLLDYEFLTNMQSNIPLYQQRAREVFLDRVKNFKIRAENLQNAMVSSALSQGAIYSALTAEGTAATILPNATGASNTVNYNLNYNGANSLNKNSQYPNTTGAANLVGDWSNASTDIENSLRTLRKSHISVSNYNPTTILYGKNIPSYLANNTSLQTYMSRAQVVGEKFLGSNEVPPGMMDYNWVPAYNAYYNDASNNYQQWWADNQIVVIPDISDIWYEFFEASVLVPNTLVPPGMSIEQLISATKPVKGYASYVELLADPLAGKLIQSWYGLPALKGINLCWSIFVS